MIILTVGLFIAVGLLILVGVNQWYINSKVIEAMEGMQNQIDIIYERVYKDADSPYWSKQNEK